MNQDNGAPPPSSTLYEIINEAMAYLEPPLNQPLTVESVARAYTLLQQACVTDCNNNNSIFHPRIRQINTILDKDELELGSNPSIDWIQAQVDLYRALLLASFLLLEIKTEEDASHTRILQSSVERCLLLLQVLSQYYSSLPVSRFPLLQAVLDEPLVPLDKQERQYMYVLQQRQKNGNPNDDDNEEMDENVVGGMNQKELAKEEQELLKLASKPVPRNAQNDNGQDEMQQDTTTSNGGENGVRHQGSLVWVAGDMKRACHVQIHDCGVVMASNEASPLRHIWLITSASTCEPRIHTDQSFVVEIRDCLRVSRIKPLEVAHETCCLEFQAESLTEGYQWVTAIQAITQSLQLSAVVQDEIHGEWKQQYDSVLATQRGLLY